MDPVGGVSPQSSAAQAAHQATAQSAAQTAAQTAAQSAALLAALRAQATDAGDGAEVQRALQRQTAPETPGVVDTFLRTSPGATVGSAPLQVLAGLPLLGPRPWTGDDLAAWHRHVLPRALDLLDDATAVVTRAGVRADQQAPAAAYVLLGWIHPTLPPELALRSTGLEALLAGSLPPAVLAAIAAQLPLPRVTGGAGVSLPGLPAGVTVGTLMLLVGLLVTVVLLWWLT